MCRTDLIWLKSGQKLEVCIQVDRYMLLLNDKTTYFCSIGCEISLITSMKGHTTAYLLYLAALFLFENSITLMSRRKHARVSNRAKQFALAQEHQSAF